MQGLQRLHGEACDPSASEGCGRTFDEARHLAAVARTLSSAREAAARGDHAEALRWLSMLDAIGHELSPGDQRMRAEWRSVLAARSAAKPASRPPAQRSRAHGH